MKNLSTIGSQIDSKILKQGDKPPRNVRARRARRGASTLDFGLWFLPALPPEEDAGLFQARPVSHLNPTNGYDA